MCSLRGTRELVCVSAEQMYSEVLTIIYNLGILGLEGSRGTGTASLGTTGPTAHRPYPG